LGPPRPEQSQHPLRSKARARRPGGGPLEPRSTSDSDAWLADKRAGAFDAAALMQRAEWAGIARLLEPLGGDPLAVLPRLAEYAARVLAWNRSVSNLISRADEARLVSRHLAESLEPAAWIAASGVGRALDFGSGAGLPAVPLALAGVCPEWVLVESRRPKILFLRKTLQDMKIDTVEPVHGRLEDVVDARLDESHSDFQLNDLDVFTSRATLTLEPTLRLAADIVRTGGIAYLWKGSRRQEEMAACDCEAIGWKAAGEFALTGGEVAVIKFERK
jgi:16S rRNA (guanine527-N7)-methyltransferase